MSIGVAAHIRAAALGGPRFDSAQDSAARRSVHNGIWLCQACSRLVDSDAVLYTSASLEAMKNAAEKRARSRLESFRVDSIAESRRPIIIMPAIYRPNPNFVPKPAAQAALEGLIPGGIQVLAGLGGIGKTQHAVQYAHRRWEAGDSVFWVGGESIEGLRSGLALVEEALADHSVALPEEPASRVGAMAERLCASDRYTLIIDNVDDAEVARECEVTLTAGRSGRVVITSRLTQWSQSFTVTRMNEWTADEGCEFLRRRLGELESRDADHRALGAALGWLPLALEQACAYIRETQCGMVAYIELLEKHKRLALSRHHVGATGYRESVLTTWDVSIKRIDTTGRRLLDALSWMSTEPLPREALLSHEEAFRRPILGMPHETRETTPEQRAQLDRALGQLSTYSLVSLSPGYVQVHPLLQAIVRERGRRRPWYLRWWPEQLSNNVYGKSLRAYRAARLLYSSQAVHIAWSYDQALMGREYLPHIEAVLTHLPSGEFEATIVVMRLRYLAGHLGEQLSVYAAGVEAIQRYLVDVSHGDPALVAECEWFINGFEAHFLRAMSGRLASHIRLTFEGLGRRPQEPTKDLYDVMVRMAAELTGMGDVDTGRRMFSLAWELAQCDDAATDYHRAQIRIGEALAIIESGSSADMWLPLLEEGLDCAHRCGCLSNGNCLEAVYFWCATAESAEQIAKARVYLGLVRERAVRLLHLGFVPAAQVFVEYLDRTFRDDEVERALASCDAALGKRSRRDGGGTRVARALLWEWRGKAHDALARYGEAARSYHRALRHRQRSKQPFPLFREINLRRRLCRAYRLSDEYGHAYAAAEPLVQCLNALPGEEGEMWEHVAAPALIEIAMCHSAGEAVVLGKRVLEQRKRRTGGTLPSDDDVRVVVELIEQMEAGS